MKNRTEHGIQPNSYWFTIDETSINLSYPKTAYKNNVYIPKGDMDTGEQRSILRS